jgi:L-asparaginase
VSKNKNILILNTGGTFNKTYNEIRGELIVPSHNKAINFILKSSKIEYCDVVGFVFKDSLDITKSDRILIENYIVKSPYEKIIIVHGTDTMDKTAKYLSKHITNKRIILTGSMVPYSISCVEPTSNLMLALGYIQSSKKFNTYIAMHGHVKRYNKLLKNRNRGVFECQI